MGLNLDAMTSQIQSQPGSQGGAVVGADEFDHRLTWEQEHQAAMAASGDANVADSQYVPSISSERSEERQQAGTQPLGLQSIDERAKSEFVSAGVVDATDLGLNLDGMDDDSAVPDLQESESDVRRRDHAEAALDSFIAGGDFETSILSGPPSQRDAMSSVASVDSRPLAPPPARQARALDDDAQSVSAVSVMSDMSSAIDGTAVPGLNLDALASSSIPAPMVPGLESTETRFESMDNPGMQSIMTNLAGSSGATAISLPGLDALASEVAPPGLQSVAEEVPEEVRDTPQVDQGAGQTPQTPVSRLISKFEKQ